jgi:hypothetical protein
MAVPRQIESLPDRSVSCSMGLPCANLSAMLRKASAWIALVALAAALVPGLAQMGQPSGASCCSAGRCPMTAASHQDLGKDHSRHCDGAGTRSTSQGASTCTCSVSQGSGTTIPPTAFRFSFEFVAETALIQPPSQLQMLASGCAAPLQGYFLLLDQPPKA